MKKIRGLMIFIYVGILLMSISRGESVFIEKVLLKDDPGEGGVPLVTRITIGKNTFQCKDLSNWIWSKDEGGFDAAALIPENRTALVGIRVETIVDAKQQPITNMGPEAYEYLQKKWAADVESGARKIDRWIGDDKSSDQNIYYTIIEKNQEFSAMNRYYFEDGLLITVGMICDKALLAKTQRIYSRFNGTLELLKNK